MLLHDLTVVIAAPNQAWSANDGQMTGEGMQGVFCGDDRVLAAATLAVEGYRLLPTNRVQATAGAVRFDYVLLAEDPGAEPALLLSRTREVTPQGCFESIRVVSREVSAVTLELRLRLRPDATNMATLRAGQPGRGLPEARASWSWRDKHTVAQVKAPGTEVVADSEGLGLAWQLEIPEHGSAAVEWALQVSDSDALHRPAGKWKLGAPPVAAEPGVASLIRRALSDVAGLRMADAKGNVFLAAGAPWYFTLFGRDSLISARFLLPIDRGLAQSTLRALAAYQGQTVDDASGERPGKIPHELRREALELSDGTTLPPVYYGTIDATLLWILTLYDAWRAGLDDASVAELLDPLQSALGWLRDHADADGDGFVEYFDPSGQGLVNQGWKDSKDSVRFADGSQAEGPIALVEVQGYAYAAARAGARLLANFGRTTVERGEALGWDLFAERLAQRFREQFWVGSGEDRYPAMALDGAKRPVDSVTSNIGHLIGTGILSRQEEELVVRRLLRADMFSGYGVRTLSADHPSYWPISYHNGSVWAHDNALILDNMRRSGFLAEARQIAAAQLRAAEGFGFSMPELFGGQPADLGAAPHPYLSACRPQAWAAAAAIPIARALATQG